VLLALVLICVPGSINLAITVMPLLLGAGALRFRPPPPLAHAAMSK